MYNLGKHFFCISTIATSIPSIKSGCFTVGSLSKYCLAYLSELKCKIATVRFAGQRPSTHFTYSIYKTKSKRISTPVCLIQNYNAFHFSISLGKVSRVGEAAEVGEVGGVGELS